MQGIQIGEGGWETLTVRGLFFLKKKKKARSGLQFSLSCTGQEAVKFVPELHTGHLLWEVGLDLLSSSLLPSSHSLSLFSSY